MAQFGVMETTALTESLLKAVRAGDAAEVERLLGADPLLAGRRTQQGVSLALTALYFGQPALAARLARGRELDVFEAAALGDLPQLERALPAGARGVAPDGFSALGLACFFGQRAAAEKLLEAGAEVNLSSANDFKVAPLHSAVSRGDAGIARLLLDHGADVNARQQRGFTPLHGAAGNGNTGLIALLLERGANRDLRSEDGQTPAELARARGKPEAASLLDPTT